LKQRGPFGHVNNELNELNKKYLKKIIELLYVFHGTEAKMNDVIGPISSPYHSRNEPGHAMMLININIQKIKINFLKNDSFLIIQCGIILTKVKHLYH
jgi:hypothetical protein